MNHKTLDSWRVKKNRLTEFGVAGKVAGKLRKM